MMICSRENERPIQQLNLSWRSNIFFQYFDVLITKCLRLGSSLSFSVCSWRTFSVTNEIRESRTLFSVFRAVKQGKFQYCNNVKILILLQKFRKQRVSNISFTVEKTLLGFQL